MLENMNASKGNPELLPMILREAQLQDIPAMQVVRRAVQENKLSHPDRIKDQDYVPMLHAPNKGWVVEVADKVVGFAVVDVLSQNIWALFVTPGHDKQGIGKALQQQMLTYAFQYCDHLWLSTEPGSRAEVFYQRTGWHSTGLTPGGEVKFEISRADWNQTLPIK
ncbi:GNAT family N-acetyltransferase [Nibribacter koreensis]|uniref:N-acetyltransferase domain-containing protein n=1 Tax=Nibribacter koreensis TaxID=1084519 RepID=A0ABP8FAU3_9BACT